MIKSIITVKKTGYKETISSYDYQSMEVDILKFLAKTRTMRDEVSVTVTSASEMANARTKRKYLQRGCVK